MILLNIGNYKSGDRADLVAQEAQYHQQSQRIYQHGKEEIKSEKHSYRIKCNLFILEFIESEVIAEQKPILASFPLKHYKKH